MKNIIFLIAIVSVLAICILSGCCFSDVDPISPDMIKIYDSIDYQLNNNGKELEVKLNFHSDFADEAFLIVKVSKKNQRGQIEGFRDSLKIDDFHIRSYVVNDEDTYLDSPIYVKNVLVAKKKNHESFKIIFPRNIVSMAGEVIINVGVVRYSVQIKNNFENHHMWDYWESRNYIPNYFKAFPDSSKTSFVFSDSHWLREFSLMRGNEAPRIYYDRNCSYKPGEYYNYGEISFSIKSQ